MDTTLHSRDIFIEPSVTGFTVHAQPTQRLTFASRQSPRRGSFVVAVVALAVVLWLTPRQSSAASYAADTIVRATNVAREAGHLAPVSTNAQLTAAAQAKADDMFAKQYFQHVSPTGAQPWSFITAAGYTFTLAGENLAADFIDGQDVITAWLNSPEHRKNLLNPSFQDIGVAVVDGTLNGQATTIVVQLFGQQHAVESAPVTPPTVAPVAVAPVRVPVIPQLQPEPAPQPTLSTQVQPAQAVDLPLPTTPSVAGLTTEVIPTLSQTPIEIVYVTPGVPMLVATIFVMYVALLVGLMAVVTQYKKSHRSDPLLAPVLAIA